MLCVVLVTFECLHYEQDELSKYLFGKGEMVKQDLNELDDLWVIVTGV